MQIKSVVFQPSEHRYGNMEAVATMDNGEKKFVFPWFDDELTFRPEELIGKTIEEARDLKQAKDIAYLQS
jgi:hypothetical protein